MPRKRNRRKKVQASRRAEIERNRPVQERAAEAQEERRSRRLLLVGQNAAMIALAAELCDAKEAKS